MAADLENSRDKQEYRVSWLMRDRRNFLGASEVSQFYGLEAIRFGAVVRRSATARFSSLSGFGGNPVSYIVTIQSTKSETNRKIVTPGKDSCWIVTERPPETATDRTLTVADQVFANCPIPSTLSHILKYGKNNVRQHDDISQP
jgi:hypothetical protein